MPHVMNGTTRQGNADQAPYGGVKCKPAGRMEGEE